MCWRSRLVQRQNRSECIASVDVPPSASSSATSLPASSACARAAASAAAAVSRASRIVSANAARVRL